MKRSTLEVAFGILVLCIALWLFIWADRAVPTKEPALTSTPTAIRTADMPVVVHTYATSSPYAVVSVTYPSFPTLPEAWNTKIREAVTAGVADHLANSEDNWKARIETASPGESVPTFPDPDARFELSGTWVPSTISPNLISFREELAGFEGGAHGWEATVTFAYDPVTRTEITPEKIFATIPGGIERVSHDVRVQILAAIEDRAHEKPDAEATRWVNDGTDPTKPENLSLFTIDGDRITFYFDQYQVAPYAFGTFTATINRSVSSEN